MMEEKNSKFVSQRNDSKKQLVQEPMLKTTTLSTQRANLEKSMKRNNSLTKMQRDNSMGKIDYRDIKMRNAIVADRIDFFNQSTTVQMNKTNTKKMGVRSKIVALETGWKTSFAPEDSKRNSQNMSLMNDER